MKEFPKQVSRQFLDHYSSACCTTQPVVSGQYIAPMLTHNTSNSRKGEKLAQRLSHILAQLHRGERLDKHRLAQEHGVDVRTIERDLSERLFGIAERDADGNWQLTHAAQGTISVKHLYSYARLSGTHYLFPDDSLRYLLEQLDTPEPSRPTRVQATPHEDLRGTPAFTQLHAAVAERRPCRFVYKGRTRLALPYRLIHKSGIWYLAAEENARLKNFSIGLINRLAVDCTTRFAINPAHVKYIDANDDVWYTTETTEVLLRVAKEAAHYFSRQQLLPNQQHRTDSDGSLLVTSKVNHIHQVLPVVRHWLPHVRILRPAAWHDELVAGLKQAVQRWES